MSQLNNENQVFYPRLMRRIRAVLTDSIIIGLAIPASLIAVSYLGLRGKSVAAALVLIIFILEPVLVAFTGGTLGHHWQGVKVVNGKTLARVGLLRATLRFLLKIPLGFLSLVIVLTSRRHQGIHDFLTGSLVVIKDPRAMPAHEVLSEHRVEDVGYVYPSKIRRVVTVLVYLVLYYLLLVLFMSFLLLDYCSSSGDCDINEFNFSLIFQFIWLLGIGAIILRGWHGRLWGCRRKAAEPADTV